MNDTARYGFEERIRDFAAGFSERMTGGRRAFFVGMRADGAVRRVYFAEDEPFDAEQKARLVEGHPRWFLYLPHLDGTYLEWLDVDAATFERWMGAPLGPGALADRDSTGARGAFPDAWRVIFR
jgi:hypothetical protein